VRSLRGRWRAHYTPKLKKRTALLAKLKDVFRRHQSQPVDRVIKLINPVLRGWVNYFRAGHSSECFGFVKDWVEKKIRRHMLRARKRQGFGWTRWSRDWLYETLSYVSRQDAKTVLTMAQAVKARKLVIPLERKVALVHPRWATRPPRTLHFDNAVRRPQVATFNRSRRMSVQVDLTRSPNRYLRIILANPATRRRQVTMTISLNPLRSASSSELRRMAS